MATGPSKKQLRHEMRQFRAAAAACPGVAVTFAAGAHTDATGRTRYSETETIISDGWWS